MSNIMYHRCEPENSKSSYAAYDTLDFILQAEGRALKRNSIRFEADISVVRTPTGANTRRVDVTDRIYWDHRVGAHAVFENFTSELQSAGMIENINEHPRYVSMCSTAEKDENDYLMSGPQTELQAPTDLHAAQYLHGVVSTNSNNPTTVDADFSLKPKICLNKMSGELSFDSNGYVKLSCNLMRNEAVFYGEDCDATTSYALTNVSVCFMTVPDVKQKVTMRTILNLKSSINSAFSNTSSKVPAICDGVSCIFLKQSSENQPTFNNNRLDNVPELDEIQFLFNDSTSKYISYVINDRADMLQKFIESLKNTDHNEVSINRFRGNGFGIGLDFPMVDLSNQKFSIQLNSSATSLSANPFILYMYFHSLVTV